MNIRVLLACLALAVYTQSLTFENTGQEWRLLTSPASPFSSNSSVILKLANGTGNVLGDVDHGCRRRRCLELEVDDSSVDFRVRQSPVLCSSYN
jgi:hypothetical protein